MIVWGCAVIDRKACVRMEQARTEHVMSRTAVRLLFQHPRWSSSLNPSRRHHRALDYQRTETTSPTKSTVQRRLHWVRRVGSGGSHA
jgi:ABC-type dipeptide/oligopeptide/nickel transport system ATPase subunit